MTGHVPSPEQFGPPEEMLLEDERIQWQVSSLAIDALHPPMAELDDSLLSPEKANELVDVLSVMYERKELSVEDLGVINARYRDKLSYKEIGEKIGKSTEQARQANQWALLKITQALIDHAHRDGRTKVVKYWWGVDPDLPR